MDNRKRGILNYIVEKNTWITSNELSNFFCVSTRTIRSDIKRINECFPNFIISNNKLGYHSNPKLNINEFVIAKDKYTQMQPQDRRAWILKKMLVCSSGINILEISDELFVSEFTVMSDIQKLKVEMKRYNLGIIRKSSCMYLIGNEENKRNLFRDLLLDEIGDDFANITSLSRLFTYANLTLVSDTLQSLFVKYNYNIKNSYLLNVILYAGICVERVYVNHFSKQNEIQINNRTVEIQLSTEFFKSYFSNENPVSFQKEIFILSEMLKISAENNSSKTYVLSRETIDNTIQLMNEKFDVDFSGDNLLIEGLLNHFQSLQQNKNYNLNVQNKSVIDIKKKYPLIFEMAICIGDNIENLLGIEINEVDLFYISLHIGSAYERMKRKEKYKLVVITPANSLIVDKLMEKINYRFKKILSECHYFSIFDERNISLIQPDLLISTMNLNYINKEIPFVKISHFFNLDDELAVYQEFRKLEEKKVRKRNQLFLKEMLKDKFFFQKDSIADSTEAISFLCEKLKSKNYITDSFKKDVMRRENISSTSFTQGFAIPHSINCTAQKSCITFLSIKEPVRWGVNNVRLVILFGISNKDKKMKKYFFDWISELITDSNKINSLVNSKTNDDYLRILLDD